MRRRMPWRPRALPPKRRHRTRARPDRGLAMGKPVIVSNVVPWARRPRRSNAGSSPRSTRRSCWGLDLGSRREGHEGG
jgi:hypothetical protein